MEHQQQSKKPKKPPLAPNKSAAPASLNSADAETID